MDYIKKYVKIVDSLIRKSFPILKKRKVIILSKDSEKYLAVTAYIPFLIIIIVDKKTTKLSLKALTGMFAHELSHTEIINKMNIFEKIGFIKWLWDKKTKAEFENKTDRLVIKKGYGKELLELNKEYRKLRTKKQLKERMSMGYLSSEKIKSYSKKIRG